MAIDQWSEKKLVLSLLKVDKKEAIATSEAAAKRCSLRLDFP